jgi:hypothetical protein
MKGKGIVDRGTKGKWIENRSVLVKGDRKRVLF